MSLSREKSSYGAGTIKRKRMTKAEVEQLSKQIYEVLNEDRPQSVRHVFYRMTNPRLPVSVDKSEAGYRQVQNRCVIMRRNRDIPYNWFADMSRRGYFTNTFADAESFVRSMAWQYRGDLWVDSEWNCEVWCESRSIASVLLDDCNELAVDLYPCGGFTSLTFAHEAATTHNRLGDPRPLKIFYVGDYDPAGVLIDQSLKRELRKHLFSSIRMDFERIAINLDQIREYDLPTKPRKATDTRSQHVMETVEAEAMPAHILREMLRDKVEGLLPQGALKALKVAEDSEREHLREVAAMLGRGEI